METLQQLVELGINMRDMSESEYFRFKIAYEKWVNSPTSCDCQHHWFDEHRKCDRSIAWKIYVKCREAKDLTEQEALFLGAN